MLIINQILEHLMLLYQIAEYFFNIEIKKIEKLIWWNLVDTSDLKSASFIRVSVQVR